MKSKTDNLLMVMNVLSWITFAGLLIKAGAILISFSVSIGNPEGAKNLYMGWNLFNVRQYNFWHYTGLVTLMAALLILEASIAFLVIKVLSKIKMENPFSAKISNNLEKISYYILGAWVIAMLHNAHTKWLSHRVDGMQVELIAGEFIFLAGVVFVIAQIFKKGVELQSENELTV